MNVLIFGLGFTGATLARRLLGQGVLVAGTRTDLMSATAVTLASEGVSLAAFGGQAASPQVDRFLEAATHVVICVPPDRDGDPVLRWHGEALARAPHLKWIGYLSTVGVYGDQGGAWIDEDTEPRPTSARSRERLEIENQWLEFGRTSGKRVDVFRIAGIYGPGRSAIDNLQAGTARRIIKPGQVFNRIHVDDIAAALEAAMRRPLDAPHRIFNLADDEPSPASDVVAYAARLIGVEPPPEVAFETAGLSPMAASFYSECKRVRNGRLKSTLGVRLAYPTYREGIAAIAVGTGSPVYRRD